MVQLLTLGIRIRGFGGGRWLLEDKPLTGKLMCGMTSLPLSTVSIWKKTLVTKLFWVLESTDVYSYKSFKREILFDVSRVPFGKLYGGGGGVEVCLKIKTFLWLFLWGRLPVRDKISRLNLINAQANRCPMCDEAWEDIGHLFIHYKNISPLWYMVASLWGASFICLHSIVGLFEY